MDIDQTGRGPNWLGGGEEVRSGISFGRSSEDTGDGGGRFYGLGGFVGLNVLQTIGVDVIVDVGLLNGFAAYWTLDHSDQAMPGGSDGAVEDWMLEIVSLDDGGKFNEEYQILNPPTDASRQIKWLPEKWRNDKAEECQQG